MTSGSDSVPNPKDSVVHVLYSKQRKLLLYYSEPLLIKEDCGFLSNSLKNSKIAWQIIHDGLMDDFLQASC